MTDVTRAELDKLAADLEEAERLREEATEIRNGCLFQHETQPDNAKARAAFQQADKALQAATERANRLSDALEFAREQWRRQSAAAEGAAIARADAENRERLEAMRASAAKLDAAIQVIAKEAQQLLRLGEKVHHSGRRVYAEFGINQFRSTELLASIQASAKHAAPEVFGALPWEQSLRQRPLTQLIDEAGPGFLHGEENAA